MFAAFATPAIWPWIGADALRARMPRTWLVSCLALAAIWVGLGYVGSLPVEGWAMAAAQVLALLYFAFFLMLPSILNRLPAARAP